jgi:heterodisulfide reductase subunit B
MKYLFYPGCSAMGTALEYKRSSEAVLTALGVELQELDDWTCCGRRGVTRVGRLDLLRIEHRAGDE